METLPIKGFDISKISSKFGMRIHPVTGERTMHYGIDYACPEKTAVYAVDSGKVVVSKMQENGVGLGNYITILHPDGTYSMYAHMRTRVVNVGNFVKAGQYIGNSGNTGTSTGPHLHFGICRNYIASNVNRSAWIDPLPKLKEAMEMIENVKMRNTDGRIVEVEAINKDGYNFVKLRDFEKLAPVAVTYDGEAKIPAIDERKSVVDIIYRQYPKLTEKEAQELLDRIRSGNK